MSPIDWRKSRNWTQAELGDALGVSHAAISRYEAGRRDWPPALARKLVRLSDGQVTLDECYAEPGEAA